MLSNLLIFCVMFAGCIVFGSMFAPAVIVWAIAHLLKLNSLAELNLVLFVVALGGTVDNILMHSGFIQFNSHSDMAHQTSVIPIWSWMIWVGFGLTLNHALKFLESSIWLQLAFGAIVPPLGYLLGERVGALTFETSTQATLVTFGIIWLVLMPIFFTLKHWIVTDTIENRVV
ncbi:DUF2878 domain-containing protein [Shewanella sp. 202IG2-18]|uniref:DUF2878 domain-containing protein n=1 Tax=Parashewanella hymeniacidonis TaxID=2807618 RepID=UPI00196223D8|nr:DUF2878 domain-containing protein [Parashewanella hymeniacidonis]MBM7074234.1 DUF2878 domain-containing protein [Parashewanella hymeniacidonis]